MGDKDKAKKARDTLSSIYAFYSHNRNSLERVPSFMSQSSGDIPIAVQVPSEEQTEQLKKELREMMQAKEAIDGLSDRDRQIMLQVANASTIKRRKKKGN
ncbi:hypothetical protein N7478_000681 [Penicillium angulare]|uniref:uncharacterized protein n=1 Tax=Penicillium angulare TaxID=116970 RepID=UPI00254177C3|nr:uncharacterized protein N7478_000681 [Penicillium angulare]KAJ5291430.1 hypothetical protein N7478_000681 [Penicillium angulare]